MAHTKPNSAWKIPPNYYLWRITKNMISKCTKEHRAAGKMMPFGIFRSFGFSVCDKMKSIRREYISFTCVKKNNFFRFLCCFFWKYLVFGFIIVIAYLRDKRWTVLFWFLSWFIRICLVNCSVFALETTRICASKPIFASVSLHPKFKI